MNPIDLQLEIHRRHLEKVLEKSYAQKKSREKWAWFRYFFLFALILSFGLYVDEHVDFPPIYRVDLKTVFSISLISATLLYVAVRRILTSSGNLGQLKKSARYLSILQRKKGLWIGNASLKIDEEGIGFQCDQFKTGFKWETEKDIEIFQDPDYLLLIWTKDDFLFIIRESMEAKEFKQIEKLIFQYRLIRFDLDLLKEIM